jgi:t-SNARE complex subunit (syntaxin)
MGFNSAFKGLRYKRRNEKECINAIIIIIIIIIIIL